MRCLKGAEEGNIFVGRNGEQPNQFNCPIGLSFDRENNFYLLDYFYNRVPKFDVS